MLKRSLLSLGLARSHDALDAFLADPVGPAERKAAIEYLSR